VQRGETINGVSPDRVMGPPRPGRKLTISGDTRPCDALKDAARHSDLLVHEATFAMEEAERAHQTGHSTASQAAGVARDAEVKLLALNHLSIRYPVATLRDEAARSSPTRCSRATSTRLRSRSANAARRSCTAGPIGVAAAAVGEAGPNSGGGEQRLSKDDQPTDAESADNVS